MTLLGIVLCLLSLVLLGHSLRRQALIRALAREVRALREREQELVIRLDDLTSKVNNSLTQISKQSGIIDKRLSQFDEKLSKNLSNGKLFELESETDKEIRDRLERLEQLSIEGSHDTEESPAAAPATTEENAPSEPVSHTNSHTKPIIAVKSIEDFLAPWQKLLERDVRAFAELSGVPAKKYSDALRKALKDHGLDALIGDDFVERIASEFEAAKKLQGAAILPAPLLSSLLAQSASSKLAPSRSFQWKSDESDRRLRTLLLVGGSKSGKTTAAVGLAQELSRRGARALLADCTAEQRGEGLSLATWKEYQQLPIVAPLVNSKPHHVAYKAIHRAQDEKFDVVILDTLSAFTPKGKVSPDVTHIAAMIAREHPYPPHETILVVDAARPADALSEGKRLLAEGSFSGLILTHVDKLPQPGTLLQLTKDIPVPLWFVSYSSSGRELWTFDAPAFGKYLFEGAPRENAAEKESSEQSSELHA